MSEISIPNTKPNKENCHQKEKYWTEEENIIITWGDLIKNNTIKMNNFNSNNHKRKRKKKQAEQTI